MAPPISLDLADDSSRVISSPRWGLDPTLTFLNHGSYGALLHPVSQAQAAYRERLERDPVRFFKVDLEGLLDGVRERLGGFLNCRPADLAPVANATIALCTILKNTPLKAGDEILITDHEYQSLINELGRVCEQTGARVVVAKIPFPIASPEVVTERFMSAVTPRTRIAFISHITSASSLIFPVAGIVREFNRRGIDLVVDGAHAPGQIPVDVGGLNPAYYIGSGHKWLGAPKGSGFMYVRADKQASFRALWLSSRVHKVRPERAMYLRDYDYFGTGDYSPILSMPQAIESAGSLLPGGWPALMRANHELAVIGRGVVARALGVEPASPESMMGSMATVPLPDPDSSLAARPTCYDDPLQDALYERHRIVVPIWRLGDQRVVRLSAYLYNSPEQYEQLASALVDELARERSLRATG